MVFLNIFDMLQIPIQVGDLLLSFSKIVDRLSKFVFQPLDLLHHLFFGVLIVPVDFLDFEELWVGWI